MSSHSESSPAVLDTSKTSETCSDSRGKEEAQLKGQSLQKGVEGRAQSCV